MSTSTKLTVPEFEQIVATGVFNGKNNRHIELIRGELREGGVPAKLSIAEFEHIFGSEPFEGIKRRRVELIFGELHKMSPIGPEHAIIVDWLNEWSVSRARGRFWVRVQNPLAFEESKSEPFPDVVWVERRGFGRRQPNAGDVLLVIEVAATTLNFDRGEKARLYATVGVQDYWIVNIPKRVIEIHREPLDGVYQSVEAFGRDESVAPLGFPRLRLKIDDLFAVLEAD